MKTALALAKAGAASLKTIPYQLRLIGGLDTETPPLSLPPGFLRTSQNYEVDVQGGYARVMGYERLDGRPSPSAAQAYVLNITLTGVIAVGDTVTGVTSGATSVVIAVPGSTSIVITKVSGTFQSGEVLNVGGNPQATTTSTAQGTSTALLRAQYKNLAADKYRNDIAAPTGSGSSLGGFEFNGTKYCWRNNAGGTLAILWKSSGTGWQQVTLYSEIRFTLGAVASPAEGETLTQGAVTATLKRLVLTSGTFAGGSAAGRFIITDPVGGNFAAGAATLSGGGTCTLSAVQTAISFLPSGRFDHIVENFGGSVNTNRVYGVDGVNRGFEFDGDVLVPITTGMTTDTPSHVHAHKKHLFFSFIGSVQHSSPGTPYIWSVITGAAEIGMGDTVNGFQSQAGSETSGALAIFTRNRTSILYGTGVANWGLIEYRKELGAYAWSIQDIGYTIFLDDQGITNLRAARTFGNFSHATLSVRIKTWINAKRTKVTSSCISRDKSQYRLFFSDNYALFVTFASAKILGMVPIKLNHSPTWAWSSELSDGTEIILFGATNGMVYQMERGTSFDGDAIEHNFQLAWDFLGSPRFLKRFHDAAFEVSGNGYAEFIFSYALGYNSTDIAQPGSESVTTSFGVSDWDDAAISWDQVNVVWDGSILSPSVVGVDGEAENISFYIHGSSDYHDSVRFSGATLFYSPRRYLR